MGRDRSNVRLNPSEETIGLGGIGIRFLVTGDDSAGGANIFEVSIRAGERLPGPPHSNNDYEETLYGVEGVSVWTVDGTPFEVGPGQALCIPRGAVHGFANPYDVDARVLVVITPAALGPEYFREVAAGLAAAAGGPPDRAKMAETMRRHGMTPVPPPPSAG